MQTVALHHQTTLVTWKPGSLTFRFDLNPSRRDAGVSSPTLNADEAAMVKVLEILSSKAPEMKQALKDTVVMFKHRMYPPHLHPYFMRLLAPIQFKYWKFLMNTLTVEEMTEMMKLTGQQRSLRFKLKGIYVLQMSSEMTAMIVSGLRAKRFRHLTLSYLHIPDVDMNTVVAALPQSNLAHFGHTVDIHTPTLVVTYPFLNPMLQAIANCLTLKSLKLSGYDFTTWDMTEELETLTTNSRLSTLTLDELLMSKGDVKMLGKKIHRMTGLRKLNIHYIQAETRGSMYTLLRGITQIPRLKSLALHFEELEANTLTDMTELFARGGFTVRRLDMRYNSIVSSIVENPSLIEMDADDVSVLSVDFENPILKLAVRHEQYEFIDRIEEQSQEWLKWRFGNGVTEILFLCCLRQSPHITSKLSRADTPLATDFMKRLKYYL